MCNDIDEHNRQLKFNEAIKWAQADTYSITRLAETRLIPIPPATELTRNSFNDFLFEKSLISSPRTSAVVRPSILRKSWPRIQPPMDLPGNEFSNDGKNFCQFFELRTSDRKSRVWIFSGKVCSVRGKVNHSIFTTMSNVATSYAPSKIG